MPSILRRKNLLVVTVMVFVLATMMIVGGHRAGADTVGTPDPVIRAKVGTGDIPVPTIPPPGPLTNLTEGSVVHLHADGNGGQIFALAVRLCRSGLNIIDTAGFAPSQSGNCIPTPFVQGSDDSFVQVNSVPPNTSVDLEVRVGTGTKTFEWDRSDPKTATITCDANNPCALWVDQQVPVNSSPDGSGHVWKHFDVTYAPRRAVADFTGDGKTDFSVYRPANGSWWVSDGTNGFWGLPGDIPVPGDYVGDGKAHYAVYRPTTGAWYVLGGTNVFWGISGDLPVPGDYNGDGKTDFAVYRPSTGAWYVLGGTSAVWGGPGLVPVPGDYTGDGKTDLAVYVPSTGAWYVLGGPSAVWGSPGDVAEPGDYDGDGKTDFATYQPSSGRWAVAGGVAKLWGLSGDVPLPLPYAIQSVFFPLPTT